MQSDFDNSRKTDQKINADKKALLLAEKRAIERELASEYQPNYAFA